MIIEGNIVDIIHREIFLGSVEMLGDKIVAIHKTGTLDSRQPYILPGFIDAHIHIESSMLVPAEFARFATVHGTVATVSDPHEIANVMGYEGVKYMIENGKKVPLKFHFGAPSCVPATVFETAGAALTTEEIEQLFSEEGVAYLAEMMNWPGVIHQDPMVMEKLSLAQKYGLPIDGHAPGLMGDAAKAYFAQGISTDHECFTYEEGRQKAELGVKIIIREGSAAKNFDALIPLLKQFPGQIMFCSDDKHPDALVLGHINELVARAVQNGYDIFDVLCAASLNPVMHYNLPIGLLRVDDPADFIIVEDLHQFKVRATYINGKKIAEKGKALFPIVDSEIINKFNISAITPQMLQIAGNATSQMVRVIEAIDGQLITKASTHTLPVKDGKVQTDVAADILKVVVLNRYHPAPPAVAYIKGFGLKSGAIASSVGHDSHNIIAVGCDDDSITKAINLIIEHKGGLALSDGDMNEILPLPVAGLMTLAPGEDVAQAYSRMDNYAKKQMGSALRSPFMLISFMALLVIPALKLSDKGLFDGSSFEFVDVLLQS
jgi:adenine deaminase